MTMHSLGCRDTFAKRQKAALADRDRAVHALQVQLAKHKPKVAVTRSLPARSARPKRTSEVLLSCTIVL